MPETKRTQEELVEMYKKVSPDDLLGVMTDDLLPFLTFENAKQFLLPGATEDDFNEFVKEYFDYRGRKSFKDIMIEYMPFAFGKAHDNRGLSASRSMDHYKVWLWLDGDDELWKTLDNYDNYGLPELRKICEYLGIDPAEHGDE